MIFLAPEQLVSKEFGDLVKDHGVIMLRTCIPIVDEAHLLNSWGMGFHQLIGGVRSRLNNPVLLALSATMRGAPFLIAKRTMEIFGFRDRHFRFFADEESRDPKTRRFSSGACLLLRELDAVADPCCELNVGDVLNPVEGL